MFKMVGCSEKTFVKVSRFAKSDGGWSQENFSIWGFCVASRQPNMIGEVGDPDFYWCRRFLKWFL